MALQRGTIDGANSLIASFASRKYYEVTKYLACNDWNFGMAVTLINEKKWESLPPDVQKEILGAAEEAKIWTRKASEEADMDSLNLLKEKGMTFFDLRGEERKKWREACKPLQDYYIERAGEKAKTILEIGERVR